MRKTIGKYRVLKQLEDTATDTTYLAYAFSSPEQMVIIRVWHAQKIDTLTPETILQEATFLTRLQHPHILPLLETGTEQQKPFLVMQYAPNGSLRKRLEQQSPIMFPVQDGIHVLHQVGQALQYAHENNVLHCSIRPEHILFDAEDNVQLSGFSLLSLFDAEYPDMRSALYWAPEQFFGSVGKESDQYALACVAYELFTGHTPFQAADISLLREKHEMQIPLEPSYLNPTLPSHIDRAIMRALAKDPTQRFSDVADFLQALTLGAVMPNVMSPQLSGAVSDAPTQKNVLKDINAEHIREMSPVSSVPLHGGFFGRMQLFALLISIVLILATIFSLNFIAMSNNYHTSNSGSDGNHIPPVPFTGSTKVTPKATHTAVPKPTVTVTPTPDPTLQAVATSPATLIPTRTSVPTPVPSPSTIAVQPVLFSSFVASSGFVNLSSEGTRDWVHWGYANASTVDRKMNVVPLISQMSTIGQNPVYTYNNNPTAFSWSDGTPDQNVNATTSGVFVIGTGNGFLISVPASTTQHVLRLYVGLWKAQGQFSVFLNGTGTSAYVDNSLNNPNGTSVGVYVITFRGNASGQSLTINYTVAASYDPAGNVTLQSATLQ